MSHVVVPNYQLFSTSEPFNAYWKLTRAMLASGWKYKASADATGAAKETTGNFALDRWGVGGGTNLITVSTQSGNTPTFGTPASGLSTITGLSGMSATLSAGRFLVFAGAINAGNNGTFKIAAYVSATSVTIFNPSAISEVGTSIVTWKEQYGGAAATIATSGASGAISGRAILTGLTGMSAPTTAPLSRGSVGDRITISNATLGVNNGTFMITRVISSTSVEIDNSAANATGETNNGTLNWVEISPLLQTYGTHLQGATGLGAWINLQGPSTVKVPIGSNTVTGTFVKGENVTQTTSTAQGAVIGVLLDTVTSNGYLVIEPRISGTGGGPRGWTNSGTDTITGAVSGATITSVAGPPVEYVREMVIWKNTVNLGHMYIQAVDQSGETASRYSTLAGVSGTTTAICPGGGSSGNNSFPTPGSWVFLGTGGSGAAGTGSADWNLNSQLTLLGNVQYICANCIEGTGVSADGSWILAQGTPSNSPGAYIGMSYMRMDDGEEGDVDPYVTWATVGSGGSPYAMTGSTRLTNTNASTSTDIFFMGANITISNYTPYKGFRRRGFATGDAYQEHQGFSLGSGNNLGTAAALTNVQAPGRVATQATANTMVREPVWAISTQIGNKMRKGYLRWIWIVEGGVSNVTYANGTWIQLSTSNGAVVAGPWDGQTIPTNA